MISKQHMTLSSCCCCMVQKAAYCFTMSIKRWQGFLGGFISDIIVA